MNIMNRSSGRWGTQGKDRGKNEEQAGNGCVPCFSFTVLMAAVFVRFESVVPKMVQGGYFGTFCSL
jgi:hypothetical protein